MAAGQDAVDADPTAPPTIYDVARMAGVSIASVSRVLNGQRNPRQETKERVLAAVAELGFVPDGAARALSARLKEVVGVIVRRPWPAAGMDVDLFAEVAESLQYPDLINRGIETAAQRRGFDLLIRSVGINDHDPGGRDHDADDRQRLLQRRVHARDPPRRPAAHGDRGHVSRILGSMMP